jgi:hypothetical protein
VVVPRVERAENAAARPRRRPDPLGPQGLTV